ncbi:hypothetical protein C8R45DRAFT_1110793 [Mycena sanguinolenta]|nr:hypothetical protein C8R45DRAFT_1110793 [Mycena sanguinolenta]
MLLTSSSSATSVFRPLLSSALLAAFTEPIASAHDLVSPIALHPLPSRSARLPPHHCSPLPGRLRRSQTFVFRALPSPTILGRQPLACVIPHRGPLSAFSLVCISFLPNSSCDTLSPGFPALLLHTTTHYIFGSTGTGRAVLPSASPLVFSLLFPTDVHSPRLIPHPTPDASAFPDLARRIQNIFLGLALTRTAFAGLAAAYCEAPFRVSSMLQLDRYAVTHLTFSFNPHSIALRESIQDILGSATTMLDMKNSSHSRLWDACRFGSGPSDRFFVSPEDIVTTHSKHLLLTRPNPDFASQIDARRPLSIDLLRLALNPTSPRVLFHRGPASPSSTILVTEGAIRGLLRTSATASHRVVALTPPPQSSPESSRRFDVAAPPTACVFHRLHCFSQDRSPPRSSGSRHLCF